MKKYILFILIIFISCEHHISNVDKKSYNCTIDSTTLTPQVKKILSEYILQYPQFEHLILDNEITIRMPLPNREAKEYYYLGPTYIGEQIGENLGYLFPSISFSFQGRRIFLKSSIDNMTNQESIKNDYNKHLEFKGIRNNIGKYYWLICIPNNQQAYIVTKDIEKNEIPISKEIQHFKASTTKYTTHEK